MANDIGNVEMPHLIESEFAWNNQIVPLDPGAQRLRALAKGNTETPPRGAN